VEVDGSIHAERREYDTARDAFLARRGLHILRVTNDEVLHSHRAVLARIATLAAERLKQLDARPPPKVLPAKKRSGEAPPPFREGAGG
jgi:very-short-patch-repair endonuclease